MLWPDYWSREQLSAARRAFDRARTKSGSLTPFEEARAARLVLMIAGSFQHLAPDIADRIFDAEIAAVRRQDAVSLAASRARHCAARAQSMSDESLREVWMEVADCWRQIADCRSHLEGKKQTHVLPNWR
jgi:hypothetical protein